MELRVEEKCHKQMQKTLTIFGRRHYLQMDETEWLRRGQGVVGGGKGRKQTSTALDAS